MYKQWWLLQNENDGEGSDLGGAAPAAEPAAPEPVGDSDGEATPAAADPNEPKSMLEAIEKGLAEQKGEPKNLPPDPNATQKQTEQNLEQPPEGLTPKAQQRFKELATRVRDAETRYSEIEGKYREAHEVASQFSTMVRSIGATPEQLQGASEYIRAINSGDLNTRKNFLLNELREVSMKMGEPVESFMPQADPLNMFPDLKEAVLSYQISREQALELVRHRAAEQQQMAALQQQEQAQSTRQAQVNQWVTEKDQAIAQIDKITREMAATDPYFPAIQAQLMSDQGGLTDIVQNFPPSTWVPQVKLLISNIRTVMAANGQHGGGGPRPLSGGGGKPQGSAKAPSSMFEAMFGNR